MESKLEQIKGIEEMIMECQKAISNASKLRDELTVRALKKQMDVLFDKLGEIKREEKLLEVEEQVVRVFNNKLEGKITLENNNLGLYQSCTEDELVVVEANLLSSAKELGIKIRFEHEYNKVQEVVEEREAQIKGIEEMIMECQKAISNASKLRDELTVRALKKQMDVLFDKLGEIKREEKLLEVEEIKSKSKKFESFEELKSTVKKGMIIKLVETTEELDGKHTIRVFDLKVNRVNKKTISMTNLTLNYDFKLSTITNEFHYNRINEYYLNY